MLAVVGLYLHPPKHTVVLSVDETTSTPALDRPHPRLPLNPHQVERLSHEQRLVSLDQANPGGSPSHRAFTWSLPRRTPVGSIKLKSSSAS